MNIIQLTSRQAVPLNTWCIHFSDASLETVSEFCRQKKWPLPTDCWIYLEGALIAVAWFVPDAKGKLVNQTEDMWKG